MLALTVSKDKHMRTWNLLKGRCAYVTNLKFDYDIVKWTPDGEYYVLVHDKTIVVNRMKVKQRKVNK